MDNPQIRFTAAVLNPNTGYGNDGQEMLVAVDQLSPLSVFTNQVCPPIDERVARMLTRSDHDAKYAIYYVQPQELKVIPGMEPTVVTMWETDHVPDEFAKRFSDVPRIVVPCQFMIKVFQHLAPWAAVTAIPFGTDYAFWGPPKVSSPEGPLRFGMVGYLDQRKCLVETMRAFQNVFGSREDVLLDCVTWNSWAPLGSKNIHIQKMADHRQFTKEELRDWYRSLDVLVYVSRGEGNGRPPLEAGCAGTPAIVSGGMGTAWMLEHPECGWAVPIEWARVPEGIAGQSGPNFYQGFWMEPDWASLGEIFLSIDEDRSQIATRGAAVAAYCQGRTWERFARDLLLLACPDQSSTEVA